MLIYLGVSALIAFAAAFVFHILGILPALAVIHLVLAIGVLPLIIGAIAHFVPVLTRGAGAPYQVTLLPVLCQLAGALVFAFFSGYAGIGALHAAASVVFLVVTGFGAWLALRAQCTLGKPHPGWRWYLVSVTFLAMGLALVPIMYIWPAMRPELRLLHIHLNVLGFVGLTAVGTLQVLLPTVLSGPDAAAASRLRRDLLPAAVGVLLM